MKLRREPLSLSRNWAFAAPLLVAFITLSCASDERECERCDYTFYWNSEGELSGSEEDCRELECRDALCGVCYEIEYNEWGLPSTSTCDSCDNYEPNCGERTTYCPMHPDECAADGVPLEACGCVDLNTNSLHCGGCFNACTDGRRCVDGTCQ